MLIYKRKYPNLKEKDKEDSVWSGKGADSWTGIKGKSVNIPKYVKDVVKGAIHKAISPEEKKKRMAKKREDLLKELQLAIGGKKSESEIKDYVEKNGKKIKKIMDKNFLYITPKMEIKDDGIFLYEMKNGAEVYYDFDSSVRYSLDGYMDNESDFVGYIYKNNKIDKKFLKELYSFIKGSLKENYTGLIESRHAGKFIKRESKLNNTEDDNLESNEEALDIEGDEEEGEEEKDIFIKDIKNADSFIEAYGNDLLDIMKGVGGITVKVEPVGDSFPNSVFLFEIDMNGAMVEYDIKEKEFGYFINNKFTKVGDFRRYIKNLGQKIDDNLLLFTDGLIGKKVAKK